MKSVDLDLHLYLNQHLHPYQYPLVIAVGPAVIGLRGFAWQWFTRVWPFIKRSAEPSNYPKARAGGRSFPVVRACGRRLKSIIGPVDNVGVS